MRSLAICQRPRYSRPDRPQSTIPPAQPLAIPASFILVSLDLTMGPSYEGPLLFSQLFNTVLS